MKPTMRLAASLCVLVALSGCNRSETITYSLREEVKELPDEYQEQVSNNLQDYFGSASNPRLEVPDMEAEVGEDGVVPRKELVSTDHLLHGQAVYQRRCAGCHGITGAGDGPAGEYLFPPPRDYRQGLFKFTSTENMVKPARKDLARTIRKGVKGTSMPSFPFLPDEELDALIDYVIYLSYRGEVEYMMMSEIQTLWDPEMEFEEDEELELLEEEYMYDYVDQVAQRWSQVQEAPILPLTPEPPFTEESIKKGEEIFRGGLCNKCHFVDGAGGLLAYSSIEQLGSPDLLSEPLQDHFKQIARYTMSRRIMNEFDEKMDEDAIPDNLRNNWGDMAYAANLTSGLLRSGNRPIDIYRRIFGGISGTPMPAFGRDPTFLEEPDRFWNVVHFVLATSQGRPISQEPIETPADEDGDAASEDSEPAPEESSDSSDQDETNSDDTNSDETDADAATKSDDDQ